MNIRLFLLAMWAARAAAAVGSEEISSTWMRYAAVSPDGKTVVFSSQGDLYKVGIDGGTAQRITSHEGVEIAPVWSKDGSQLAFAGFRHGNFDVYVMPAQGGPSIRLTQHSQEEIPYAFSEDGRSILFTASIQEPAVSSRFPTHLNQLYEVDAKGGRSRLVAAVPMMNLDTGSRGILYEDYKGYEDEWRKHHQSPVARDIWLYDTKKSSFQKLTHFAGEDRNPRWAPDGQGFYFLSEASGSFNVWYQSLDSSSPRQITFHQNFPVRYLTISKDGVLVYSLHGELYRLIPGQQASRIPVDIKPAEHTQEAMERKLDGNVSEFAISPKQREIAFAVRGDLYVASIEFGTTKRITQTPEQERNVSFNRKGDTLIYEAERNGRWDIYQTRLPSQDEKYFADSTLLEEKQLTDGPGEKMMPKFSPDGRYFAFLEDRSKIRVQEITSGKKWTLIDSKLESYNDGDIWFDWSADSSWLVFEYRPSNMESAPRAGLIDVHGRQGSRDLTRDGYGNVQPVFTQDGQAIVWSNASLAHRSHLLGDRDALVDLFVSFLNFEALDRFEMSAEDFERQKEIKEANKEDKKKLDEPVKPISMDWDGLPKRFRRLTPFSSDLKAAYLQKDFDKLYFMSRVDKNLDIWQSDLKKSDTKKLITVKGEKGYFKADFDGKNLVILADGSLHRYMIKDNQLSPISIKGSWEKSSREYVYLFDHIWRQIQKKFYNLNMHQVDWEALKRSYEKKLPFISNELDFAELTSEMAGELNASHMGTRWRVKMDPIHETATLGIITDLRHPGPEIKVDEILNGGPMEKWKSRLKPGFLITAIDGRKLTADMDPYALLEGKAGQKIRLECRSGSTVESVVLKPISKQAQDQLLYARWVQNRRNLVDKLSGGRVAYVHIKGMNDPSYRTMISELYGHHPKAEALIVDTRFNGGGWLHDELSAFLSGQPSYFVKPQGRLHAESPRRRWSKPSVVVMSAGNYSDAHAFPYVYKTLKLGPLVGEGVAGTSTAVWWETLHTGNLIFGIPQWGITALDGSYLENQTLQPDYEVGISPEDFLAGRDPQIEKATALMLEALKGGSRIVEGKNAQFHQE